MKEIASPSESSVGLDELLEEYISKLSQTLSQSHTLAEVEAQVTVLNDLVYTFKRRDELLEKLLDGDTVESKRREIHTALAAQHIRVAEGGEAVARIHAQSHGLLERSARLIIKAQSLIYEMAHKQTGYAMEVCGLCRGFGGTTEKPCPPCKGKGSVLVHQPSLQCPRCKGDGKPPADDHLTFAGLCVVCRGSGWVMTSD